MEVKAELVWMGDKCNFCHRINVLRPYKGDEINLEEPDRLVCSACGHEYAINMNNPNRELSPLIGLRSLDEFMNRFTERCK